MQNPSRCNEERQCPARAKRHLHGGGKTETNETEGGREGTERKREFAEMKHFHCRREEQLCKLLQRKTKNRGGRKGAPMRAYKEAVLPLTAEFPGAVSYSCLLYLSPHKCAASCPAGTVFTDLSHVRPQGVTEGPVLDAPAPRCHLQPSSVLLFLPFAWVSSSRFT